jgi:hypothetical protein
MATPLPPPSLIGMARALFKRARPGAAAPFSTEYLLDGIAPAHLERYNQLFGFAPGSLPVSYYYLLAQRAHLPTLLEPAFPFRVAGLVHASNEIVEHRRPGDAPMRLVTTVQVEAPRANGAVYCTLVTRAVDAGTPLFTCTSSYLAVRGTGRGGSGSAEAPPWPALGAWQLDGASGRRYAAVSGDWNPIHLWP